MQIWSHAQKFFIWIEEWKKVKDPVAYIVETMYDPEIVQEMNEQEGKLSRIPIFDLVSTNSNFSIRIRLGWTS